MTYRETILSDHEWSDDDNDDDGLENEFLDHSDNDEEILTNNQPETIKPFYRVGKLINKISMKFIFRLIIKKIFFN